MNLPLHRIDGDVKQMVVSVIPAVGGRPLDLRCILLQELINGFAPGPVQRLINAEFVDPLFHGGAGTLERTVSITAN